jgi:hypothetical protein
VSSCAINCHCAPSQSVAVCNVKQACRSYTGKYVIATKARKLLLALPEHSIQALQATEDMRQDLFYSQHVDEQIASITFGVLGGNLQQDAINKMCAALHSLDEWILEGAATTERGDRAFRTHMQGMFLMLILDAPDSHLKLRDYLIAHMGIRDEGTEQRGTVRFRSSDTCCTVERSILFHCLP